jgi:manganese/zinc/iron transport system substrate-binding protein
MIFLRLCFLLLLCACSGGDLQNRADELKQWKEPNGKLKVLSTTGMIDDLVKQIGDDHVDSIILIKGELDPHSYQLVKGDDEKLLFANLIFSNGLGLEHGPSLQRHLSGNPKAVPLGNLIMKEDPNLILHYNGQLDPHIWMDISLWEKTVPFIVEALSKQDPAHAGIYRANGDKLISEMKKKHEEIKREMVSIPAEKRFLVTSHDAFNYFTRAYLATDEERKNGSWQKRFAAPEGLAPESQLSVTDIQMIIDHLKKYNIHVLFPETNVSKDSIRKIISAGKEKGLELFIANPCLYGDAMGPPGSDGDTYLKMIQHNATTIAEYLKHNN